MSLSKSYEDTMSLIQYFELKTLQTEMLKSSCLENVHELFKKSLKVFAIYAFCQVCVGLENNHTKRWDMKHGRASVQAVSSFRCFSLSPSPTAFDVNLLGTCLYFLNNFKTFLKHK